MFPTQVSDEAHLVRHSAKSYKSPADFELEMKLQQAVARPGIHHRGERPLT